MFVSGPHVSCYRAVSADDGSLVGVRCVKFANLLHCPDSAGVAFAWYGEGVAPTGPYRHFGEAFITEPALRGSGASFLTAHAAGIVGNGERTEPFMRLRFEVASTLSAEPARLVVTGDLREEWKLQPDGVATDYSPLARHIERVGPHLNEFAARKRDGTPGFGVRAILSSGSWLGAGRWRDLTYLHIGTYIGVRTGPLRFGASDIAAGNSFSGHVPWGELNIRAVMEGGRPVRHVTGAWSETWELRSSATEWAPEPQVADLTAFG